MFFLLSLIERTAPYAWFKLSDVSYPECPDTEASMAALCKAGLGVDLLLEIPTRYS